MIEETIQISKENVKESQTISVNPDHEKSEKYIEAENALNADILKITMIIKEQYPELSKYIEEMPVTIPDQKAPEVTLKNLQTYYNSLKDMLNKYIPGHPNDVQ